MAVFLILKTGKVEALRDPKYQRREPNVKQLNESAPMLLAGFSNFDKAFTQDVIDKYTTTEPYKTHYHQFLELGYNKYIQQLKATNKTFIVKRGKNMANDHIENFMKTTLDNLLATADTSEKAQQELYREADIETRLRVFILKRLMENKTAISSPEEYLFSVALKQLDDWAATQVNH